VTAWRKEIIDGDIEERIHREYRNLLSVGKSSEEAEELLEDYFHSQLSGDELIMGRFWMTLALY